VFPDLTHRVYRDFNFSAIWRPSLDGGPSFEALFKLVYQARQGDHSAALEFGDTMFYTLRPAAFEAYQRKHGPHAFSYAEWFYTKVKMFFEILIYKYLDANEMMPDGNIRMRVVEQPWNEGVTGFFHHAGEWIEDDEIEQGLVPEDNEVIGWGGLALEVSRLKTNRVEYLRNWLRDRAIEKTGAARGRIRWGKNRERDQIILNCFERRKERADICKELDRLTIPTVPSLQKAGLQRWSEAWSDPEGRQTIQQLFSKLLAKRVKTRAVSK
jgi:hypothetical protein